MGGTWIHWQQGYFWRELGRYNLDRDIKVTPNAEYPSRAFAQSEYNGKTYKMSVADNDKLLNLAFGKLLDVDGVQGLSVVPIPHHQLESQLSDPALVAKYDNMSIADRINEAVAAGLLDDQELAFIVPWVELSWGTTTDRCSFLELVKWFVLGNSTYSGMMSQLATFKLKKGQSHLARRIFDEARSTGNLSYAFDTVVQSVVDRAAVVQVTSSLGTFSAAKVISTLPLNVADQVSFDPPLSKLRAAAFSEGHINLGDKIANLVSSPDFRSWTGYAHHDKDKSRLACAFGDQVLREGTCSSVVTFGSDSDPRAPPSKSPEQIASWLSRLDLELEEKYIGSIWHEWVTDPFAKGTWAMAQPGFTTTYLKELQAPHGNVLWASADWADGWKGFIDGAIEQGTRAAFIAVSEWRRGPARARL